MGAGPLGQSQVVFLTLDYFYFPEVREIQNGVT